MSLPLSVVYKFIGDGNLMSLSVHALHVADVIILLNCVFGIGLRLCAAKLRKGKFPAYQVVIME